MAIHRQLLLGAALVGLCGCSNTTTDDNAPNSVNDALENRPAEDLRDAAEEVDEGVDNAADELEDAVDDDK